MYSLTPVGLLYRDQYVCWQQKASYKLFDYAHRITEVLGVTDIMAPERLVWACSDRLQRVTLCTGCICPPKIPRSLSLFKALESHLERLLSTFFQMEHKRSARGWCDTYVWRMYELPRGLPSPLRFACTCAYVCESVLSKKYVRHNGIIIFYVDDTVQMIWLGLGTKTTWLGLGKKSCFGLHVRVSSENIQKWNVSPEYDSFNIMASMFCISNISTDFATL